MKSNTSLDRLWPPSVEWARTGPKVSAGSDRAKRLECAGLPALSGPFRLKAGASSRTPNASRRHAAAHLILVICGAARTDGPYRHFTLPTLEPWSVRLVVSAR